MNQIVLWGGKLKIRVSEINAIREVYGKMYVYVSGIDQHFLCEDRKDVELLRNLDLGPCTEGPDWQVDVEEILRESRKLMEELKPVDLKLRFEVDSEEFFVMSHWREGARIVNKNPRRHP